jgi:hypothetical protein
MQFDPKMKENAFASPRSWQHTSELIKDIGSDQLQLIQQLTATQVGVGMSGEFAAFIRVKDKLKPMDYYLKDPDNCDLPDEGAQPDLLWALITSFAEHYKDQTRNHTPNDIHCRLHDLVQKQKKKEGRFPVFYLTVLNPKLPMSMSFLQTSTM